MTIIKGSRIADLLHWHDDMAGDQTTLFVEMTNHRDTAALIRQLQAEVQDAWQAGLDEGRAQGAAKQPPRALACNYTPATLDRTAPPRIWLQIDTAADNNDRAEPWPGTLGVTWQDESVGGLEIQYVRADLARLESSDEAMVLVPREPTPAILEAFGRMDHWLKTAEGYRYLVQAAADGARGEPYWKAMIEAAQQGTTTHA